MINIQTKIIENLQNKFPNCGVYVNLPKKPKDEFFKLSSVSCFDYTLGRMKIEIIIEVIQSTSQNSGILEIINILQKDWKEIFDFENSILENFTYSLNDSFNNSIWNAKLSCSLIFDV